MEQLREFWWKFLPTGGHKVASHFIPTCSICNKAILLENCKVDGHGKGVHAACYTAKLAHPTGKSIREKEERSWELCELAAKEQDPHKLLTLVHEINALLEEKECGSSKSGKTSTNPLNNNAKL